MHWCFAPYSPYRHPAPMTLALCHLSDIKAQIQASTNANAPGPRKSNPGRLCLALDSVER